MQREDREYQDFVKERINLELDPKTTILDMCSELEIELYDMIIHSLQI